MTVKGEASLRDWVLEAAYHALASAMFDGTFAERFDHQMEVHHHSEEEETAFAMRAQSAYDLYSEIGRELRRKKSDPNAFINDWQRETNLDVDSNAGRQIVGLKR